MAEIPDTAFSDLDQSLAAAQTEASDPAQRELAGAHRAAIDRMAIAAKARTDGALDAAAAEALAKHSAHAVQARNIGNWAGVVAAAATAIGVLARVPKLASMALGGLPDGSGWTPGTLDPPPK